MPGDAQLVALLGSAVAGLGVYLTYRASLDDALSEGERRRVRRFYQVLFGAIVAFLLASAPLIIWGGDWATRRQPVKAWIAVGDVACGALFAFGGVAAAPLCIGGLAIALLAIDPIEPAGVVAQQTTERWRQELLPPIEESVQEGWLVARFYYPAKGNPPWRPIIIFESKLKHRASLASSWIFEH